MLLILDNFGLFPKELVLFRRLSGFAREAKIQSDFVPLTDLITCKRREKMNLLTINTHSWLEEEPLKIRGDCQGDFIF